MDMLTNIRMRDQRIGTQRTSAVGDDAPIVNEKPASELSWFDKLRWYFAKDSE